MLVVSLTINKDPPRVKRRVEITLLKELMSVGNRSFEDVAKRYAPTYANGICAWYFYFARSNTG